MAALHPLTTLRYGSFAFPASAEPQLDAALSYLSRDGTERSLIDALEHGRREYRLVVAHDGNDYFDPADDTIHWDPLSALRTSDGGTQSPALGLGHEIDHAVEDPAREQRLAAAADACFDNLEERRVITGSERHAAQTLGEAVRRDHQGSPYRVGSPVERRTAEGWTA